MIVPLITLAFAWALSTFLALHNMSQLRKAWARENELHRLLSDQTARFLEQTNLLVITTDNLNWALAELERHRIGRNIVTVVGP